MSHLWFILMFVAMRKRIALLELGEIVVNTVKRMPLLIGISYEENKPNLFEFSPNG